jgi:uncharacterized cupin superfamily protein
MNTDSKVIRLEKNGPQVSGLQPMQLNPIGFQSELPEQHIHVYYEDAELGLSVGVWTTTTMQEAFGPYPGDEFMWVLEGQACMLDDQENEIIITPGQSFLVRNAIPISWKQIGFLRKFYITYANPNRPTPKLDSANGGIKVLDPGKLHSSMAETNSTEPFIIKDGTPIQKEIGVFENDEKNMFVGMWQSSEFLSEMSPFPFHEFVQLLEGEVVISETDGTVNTFKAGDTFFIPKGTVCQWQVIKPILKYYAILDSSV